MEHRTLKVIPTNTTLTDKTNKNCQEIELPPPARILPYSGIKPQVIF